MPTLIQQPNVADTQVSQLQAVAEPVSTKSGLSDFILGILPVAADAFTANQKANAQHNVALGMNDELNNFTRDVSFMDQKYYDQGREIQAVEAFNAERSGTYDTELLKLARDNPNMTSDELLQKYEGMNQKAIDVLYEANIDQDIKEKLYEAYTQKHAAQVKTVTGIIKQVGDEVERDTRKQRSQDLLGNLLSGTNTVEQNAMQLASYKTRAAALHMRRGEDPRKAAELADAEIKTIAEFAAKTVLDNIDVDPTNVKLLNDLQELSNYGIQTGDIDIGTLSAMGGILNTAQTKVLSMNADNLAARYVDIDAQVTAGKTEYTYEVLNSDLKGLAKQRDTGQITQAQYVQEATKYTNLFERSEKARLSATPPESSIIDMDVSLTEAMYNYDMTETEYTDAWATEMYKRANGDPIEAAKGMITKSIGKEDLVKLRQKGSETFWRQISLKQTAAEFKADPRGENKAKAFEELKALYLKNATAAPSLAADLLSGLDDKDRAAVVQAFQSNGTLADAMHNTQRVVEITQQNTSYKQLIDGLNVDNLNLKGWGVNVLGSAGFLNRAGFVGGLFNETGSAIKEKSLSNHVGSIRAVLENSPEMSTTFANLDPKAVVGVLKEKGMAIESSNGHQATYLNSRAAKALPQAMVGVPEASKSQYLSRAIDLKRQELAGNAKAQYGATVSIDQIHMVSSGKSSTLLVAHIIGDKGQSIGDIPVYTSELASGAARIYNTDIGKAKGDVKQFKASGFKAESTSGYGVMGKIDALYGAKVPEYSVNTKGSFTRRTVVAKDNQHSGQKFVVSIPNTYTVPFNGNTALASAWFDHTAVHEGVFLSTQGVKDTQSGKMSYNAGVQVSLNNNDPKWRKKFEAAKGDAQQTINVQAEFNQEHFAGLQDAARRAGIPVATQGAYPKQHLGTQIFIADLNYHYGATGREQAVRALTQRDAIAGRSILHSSPAYKSAHISRKQMLDQAIDNHYRNKGTR